MADQPSSPSRVELQYADLVLSPSRSAARVLAANGIAPDRLAVDENGLPEADIVASPAASPSVRPRHA